MIRRLKDLVTTARKALGVGRHDEHIRWTEGDLTADVWRTYSGWRWIVLDTAGGLIKQDRSAELHGAIWAAGRVMRRHAEAGAA